MSCEAWCTGAALEQLSQLMKVSKLVQRDEGFASMALALGVGQSYNGHMGLVPWKCVK